ncbi:putative uncharacterized protein [Prevotella sp. CAG:873]|jgi:hypothetical protein|nr:putative uncharacterized protein [Prevotella sp. CAG:873]
MASITLNVNKADVWSEVAKTSGYTGDKMTDTDKNAYERILITDEDQKSLQRFWEEAVAVANDQLKEMLEMASPMNIDYNVTLNVSRSYDTVLNASVQAALTSYFISAIVGRWYKFSNKSEADSYLSEAANMMDDVLRKLYSRKRPRRPNREITVPVGPHGPIINPDNPPIIIK